MIQLSCCSSEIRFLPVLGTVGVYANLSVPCSEMGRRHYLAENGQEIICLDGRYKVQIQQNSRDIRVDVIRV